MEFLKKTFFIFFVWVLGNAAFSHSLFLSKKKYFESFQNHKFQKLEQVEIAFFQKQEKKTFGLKEKLLKQKKKIHLHLFLSSLFLKKNFSFKFVFDKQYLFIASGLSPPLFS